MGLSRHGGTDEATIIGDFNLGWGCGRQVRRGDASLNHDTHPQVQGSAKRCGRSGRVVGQDHPDNLAARVGLGAYRAARDLGRAIPYRFKTNRKPYGLGFHKISYAAW